MNHNPAKDILRRQILDDMATLPDGYITESDDMLRRHVTGLGEFQCAGNIFVYYSVGREPGTLGICEEAFRLGKTVAFPYCHRNGVMQARVVDSLDRLVPAALGIPAPPDDARVIEPDALDLIIVPALTYDEQGYRLGRGGGYYDRYLYGLAAFTVGLARTRLLMGRLPREPHDMAVKCLVTELGCEYIVQGR